MSLPESNRIPGKEDEAESRLEVYVPPKIVTYTSEELLEQVGPALTCSPSPCGVPAGAGSARPNFRPKR